MHLDFGDEYIPVTHLELDFAILDTAVSRPPGPARLSVAVDDELTVRQVFLPDGIRPGPHRTRLANASQAPSWLAGELKGSF